MPWSVLLCLDDRARHVRCGQRRGLHRRLRRLWTHDIKNVMHTREREDLVDLRLWTEQPHGALPALRRLLQRNQRAKTATIEKGRF